MGTTGTVVRGIRVCPNCRPLAVSVRRPDGTPIKGWQPEALYVGFLDTRPFHGRKKTPQECPNCGRILELHD